VESRAEKLTELIEELIDARLRALVLEVDYSHPRPVPVLRQRETEGVRAARERLKNFVSLRLFPMGRRPKLATTPADRKQILDALKKERNGR